MALLEHPKLQEEQGSLIFSLLAHVSSEDTSYATVSHEIMLACLARFLDHSRSNDLLEKVQTLVRALHENLLELEPISRAAAQAQMKRQ